MVDPLVHSVTTLGKGMETHVERKSKPWQAAVDPKLNNTKQYIDDLNKSVTNTRTVKVNAELSNTEAFKKELKEALQVKLNLKATVDKKTSTIGTIGAYTVATGGIGGILDMPGQLFIAREAGPELVGTMGGHNAVANNQQIVEGIQSGVAQANQEQNALLGQIVNGVYQLLQKDITISPSAALGQVMARSADMYARA